MLRTIFPSAKNILLDANLLVVLFIGQVRETLFGSSPVSEYTNADYELIRGIASEFDAVVTTPYLLAEVNSLLNTSYAREECREALALLLPEMENRYTEPITLSKDPFFLKFGISDVSIIHALGSDTIVLTSDGPLAGKLGNAYAIHFADLKLIIKNIG